MKHCKEIWKHYAWINKYIKKNFPREYNGFCEHAREKAEMYLGVIIGHVEEDGDPFFSIGDEEQDV